MKVKTASGLIKLYMRLCGFRGWTSFWSTIYIWPGYEGNERLLRHEARHLEQIERDGRLLFAVRYLWWVIRYGYRSNPYEVDARRAENG